MDEERAGDRDNRRLLGGEGVESRELDEIAASLSKTYTKRTKIVRFVHNTLEWEGRHEA